MEAVRQQSRVVTVALVTDDPISQAGISAALSDEPGLELVDVDGEVAVLVVDQVDETVQQITRRMRRNGVVGVVLVVGRLDDQGVLAAVEAGACGVLRRSETTAEQLAAAIRQAHDGAGTMSPELLGRLMAHVTQLHDQFLQPQGIHVHGLSDREIEVLRLVAEGLGTFEIARTLAYSERTIKNIIQGVTNRLQLRNRSHAVAYAVRQGLI
jgi:DNA-binding NarL/FixJ family response regulator